MYGYNAGPPIAIPIYTVLPYCVIMQVIATKSKHIIMRLKLKVNILLYGYNAGPHMAILVLPYSVIQEQMNLLHGNKLSPWEDFPFGSDVISPNQLCKCTCMYRCWSKHMPEQLGFAPGKYNCFINRMFTSIQVNNLERDCIKSRRDKIGITRHIMMHQVLYNVHVTLFIGQLHNITSKLKILQIIMWNIGMA